MAYAGVEKQQRARGSLLIHGRRAGTRTCLQDLRQEGCLRACFPREEGPALNLVLLNMAGGVTDGDVLRTMLHAGSGADMVASTAAAERIYRARRGATAAEITVNIKVGAGAHMAYLPQETILFDGCALDRHLRIDLAAGSFYLGVETLVFGRAASGEILRGIFLRDTVSLRREGRLLMHDQVLLRGAAATMLAGKAMAGGACVVSTLLHSADDSCFHLDAVRREIARAAVAGAASFRDGVLVARIVAADVQGARRATGAALAVLRGGRALPRVWGC